MFSSYFTKIILSGFIGEFFWLFIKSEIMNEFDIKVKVGLLNTILEFIFTVTVVN